MAAAFALGGRAAPPSLTPAGWVYLGALAALTAWAGLSLVWSVEADRSWAYLNFGLVYLACATLGALAGSALGTRTARLAAGTLAVALGLAVVWALAGKVVPALDPEGDRVARLRGTLDYWNAFALLAAAALPLALWVATMRAVLGALLGYGALVALLLTFSRGGLLVALVGIGLWLLVAPRRLEALAILLASAVPAAVVAVVAFALPGVSRDEQPRDVRADDGLVFGLALLAGAAAVAVLARAVSRVDFAGLPVRTRKRLVAGVVALALVAATGAVGAATAIDSGPLTVEADPGRLLKLGSSDRWQWWTESVQIFRKQPLGGSGAGTFDVARRPFRDDASVATEPHSVPLQFAAELGLVGLVLLAAVVAAAAVAAGEAIRRLAGPDALAARALAVVLALYAVHVTFEFDWDYLALTGPAVLLAAALAAAGRGREGARRGLLPRAASLALGAAALLSLAAPRVAAGRLADAREALSAAPPRPAAAAAAASDAHEINPLSEDILLEWALAESLRGDRARARELYARAIELQPENPDTWRSAGVFELDVGSYAAARHFLTRARELDPHDPLTLRLLAEVPVG